MSRPKTVLVLGDSPVNDQAAVYLFEHCPPDAVLVERAFRPASLLRHLRSRFRRYGLVQTLDQVLLYAAGSLQRSAPRAVVIPPEVPRLDVGSVNAAAAIAFVREVAPEFCLNLGGGLMRPDFFSLPAVSTLNVHPGVLPRYRGLNANLWAVHENAFNCMGTTVHAVIERIDAGTLHAASRFSGSEVRAAGSLDGLMALSMRRGAELLCDLMDHYAQSGSLPVIEPTLEGRLYGAYGWRAYRVMQRNYARYCAAGVDDGR